MVKEDDLLYSIGENLSDDFEASQYLNYLVLAKLQTFSSELNGKHCYSLTVTHTPQRKNYHLFSFEYLQEISRKLTNGLNSLGSISNRKFWSRYFLGGVRTISVTRELCNDYPSFHLNFLVYSNYDDLDIRLKQNMSMRIRFIDTSLTFSLMYLGKYSSETIQNGLPTFQQIEMGDDYYIKFGQDTIEQINKLPFQRPRFFGRLFKTRG